MRLPIVHHPDYVAPLRSGHRFPMSKYGYLREALDARGFLETSFLSPAPASSAMIGGAHDPDYVARAFAGTLSTQESRRIGLPQTPLVLRRARLAASGTLLASRMAAETGIALNSAGGSHHARREHGAGYCLFNDVAIAIAGLRASGVTGRVLALDCDVHQGDGTAAIFADDASVVTASLHCAANYPFRKERGDLDIALPPKADDPAYLAALESLLARASLLGPFALAFYNAGVDVHADDRLGRFALSDRGLRARERRVIGWALEQALPVAVVMGGGYDDDRERLAARHAIVFEEARAALDLR